ncbi:hypothetical protein [Orlajensenia leifsoniae]|uniref:Uncharacterized protein n=1 Tax=Orlajensenia leifsoniae TaxID=2561933 RepID=A0A4Y9R0U2_9MICO|nr:hypothetical protein [Leifsonia flava]TFV98117.1 hypothetical protein E4M00_08780 [Leifsonia flava]
MARSTVEIRNETTITLELADQKGHWAAPPPRAIRAGSSATITLEAGVFGSSGRLVYTIGSASARHLDVTWKSGFLDRDHSDDVTVEAPQGFDASVIRKNERAVVRVLESARHAVPGFRPSRNGLHFTNSWSHELPVMAVGKIVNDLLDAMPAGLGSVLQIARRDPDWMPLTRADAGLCGGMVFTALDYFSAKEAVPALRTSPTASDDPLFLFIRERMLDSLDLRGDGHRWLSYSAPQYPDDDEGLAGAVTHGRRRITFDETIPAVRGDIDAGRPSPIGLIRSVDLDIGKNHQVMAYAYEQKGAKTALWLYDPNEPDNDDLVLRLDADQPAGRLRVTRESRGRAAGTGPIYCIMSLRGYRAQKPPVLAG